MKRFILVVLACFVLQTNTSYGASVAAKKAILVGKSAVYGLGAGLVVGLAWQVFKKDTKNIFLAGSLGMYSGIALGLYLIFSASEMESFEGPDTYEEFQGWDSNIWEAPLGDHYAFQQQKELSAEVQILSIDF